MMAKLRPPEKKSSSKKMSSSLSNSDSSSYSSSPESRSSSEYLDQMISSLKSMQLSISACSVDEEPTRHVCSCKALGSSDDEDDEGLVERGPVRPQAHPMNRSRPYVDSACHQNWTGVQSAQHSENSTDLDTSAKAILTDCEYRKKIDFCLDKLTDMTYERPNAGHSLSPTHSDFGGTSSFSPNPKPARQREKSPSSLVPSITVCDSESSLLEILSRGGFQLAHQSGLTPEYNSTGSVASSSMACASDNWPDSPGSSFNATATSVSRPDSRSSSRAQSPGSNNGCATYGTNTFLNVLGSPTGSPQVSPREFRQAYRASSSSSSSQSYCETPSPANYQNPLDQQLEEQLGEHMSSQLPAWRESFESSETLVNSVDSSELQLQLVEEVIRGDMKDQRRSDMQVVPNCKSSSPQSNHSEYSTGLENGDAAHDELTSTLLRFVGDEQAIASHRRVDNRLSPSSTSGYGSGSGSDTSHKACNGFCLSHESYDRSSSVESPPMRQQLQTVYQHQCANMSTTDNLEGLQFSTTSTDLIRKNLGENHSNSKITTENQPHNSHNSNGTRSGNFNNFQMPGPVSSYHSQRSKSGLSAKCLASTTVPRSIAPWPSLNLPSTRACERLKEATDSREVERAMKNLLQKPLEQLAKPDEDGDTMLMCLAGNPMELGKKLAFLAPLVERLSSLDGALETLNRRGEDALYLAAINCPHMAFVAGYLAAAFLQRNIDVGQRLYRSRGDSLVHILAAKGDAHTEVLAELLSLKTRQGNPVFDLSKRNYDGRTPLHVATEAHESVVRNTKTISIKIVKLLLENGADPTERETRCGDTALHLAISWGGDPSLVKALLLLSGSEAVHVTNYNGNSPLHVAAAISERTSLERQSEICWLLIRAGARTNSTNRQGKTPLALVSAERKEAIRQILHQRKS